MLTLELPTPNQLSHQGAVKPGSDYAIEGGWLILTTTAEGFCTTGCDSGQRFSTLKALRFIAAEVGFAGETKWQRSKAGSLAELTVCWKERARNDINCAVNRATPAGLTATFADV